MTTRERAQRILASAQTKIYNARGMSAKIATGDDSINLAVAEAVAEELEELDRRLSDLEFDDRRGDR